MERIGFIGLGIMGKPMARNLLKAGYSVVVHNRSRSAVEELATEGAKAASSSKEVAGQCDALAVLGQVLRSRQVVLGVAGSNIDPAGARLQKALGHELAEAPGTAGNDTDLALHGIQMF